MFLYKAFPTKVFSIYLEQIEERNSSPRGWWDTGRGCPEKVRMPSPWKCSRPGWMGLWATWS